MQGNLPSMRRHGMITDVCGCWHVDRARRRQCREASEELPQRDKAPKGGIEGRSSKLRILYVSRIAYKSGEAL